MRGDKYRPHSFAMPASMVVAIAELAGAMGQSMSHVVRLAVRAYLSAHGHPYPDRHDREETQGECESRD